MIQSCVFTDEISLDFEEAVKTCAELHVRYIEPRAIWDTDINTIDLEGARKMKLILDRHGVKVGIIGSGFGKCRIDDDSEWERHLKILERQFKFCDLFGTRKIRCFPFYYPDGTNWQIERPSVEDYLDRIVEKLKTPCKMAEREGIILSLETEPSTFSGSCLEVRTIADAAGSDALSCCWDIANSWHFGTVAYPDGYELVRGAVTHVHVKDIKLDPQDLTKPVGTTHIDLGDIPYHDIFGALISDGYDGLASIETHLFFGMADRFRWLKPATVSALRNLNRVLAEVQGGF